MLLEIDTTSVGGIVHVILGVLAIPIILYLFSIFYGYLFGGISKVTGRTLSYRGNPTYTPDTIDALNQHVKENVSQAASLVKTLYTKTKGKIDSAKAAKIERALGTSTKIEMLQQIQKLHQDGTITLDEFYILKEEILLN